MIGTGAGAGVTIEELTAAGFRVVTLGRGAYPGAVDFAKHDEIGNWMRGAGTLPYRRGGELE